LLVHSAFYLRSSFNFRILSWQVLNIVFNYSIQIINFSQVGKIFINVASSNELLKILFSVVFYWHRRDSFLQQVPGLVRFLSVAAGASDVCQWRRSHDRWFCLRRNVSAPRIPGIRRVDAILSVSPEPRESLPGMYALRIRGVRWSEVSQTPWGWYKTPLCTTNESGTVSRSNILPPITISSTYSIVGRCAEVYRTYRRYMLYLRYSIIKLSVVARIR